MAEEATKKKKNVGKDLSSKSLQELYDGRAALQGKIDELQAQYASDRRGNFPRGSVNYKSYRDPYAVLDQHKRWRWKHGPQLEANIKLFDLINKEIEVKEMDVEEDMSLDGEPSPYDEEALKEALATGGKVEAPDWVIDALLEELPSGTVEGGDFMVEGERRWTGQPPRWHRTFQGGKTEIVESPKGGETTAEAAESWRGLQAGAQEEQEASYETDSKLQQAGRVVAGHLGWGSEDPEDVHYANPYKLAVSIEGLLDLEKSGKVQIADPKLRADLEGFVSLAKQRRHAYASAPSDRTIREYGKKAELVEEEFPEAKKKAE